MIVCSVSGVPREECDYSCPHCAKEYRGVPDLAGIREGCVAIQEGWTKYEERKRRAIPVLHAEIKLATRVFHFRHEDE